MGVNYANLKVGCGKFYYGHGCIKELTSEIIRLGGRPLIIGGPSSVDKIVELSADEWREQGIEAQICRHDGACSRGWADTYAKMAAEHNCTVIVGIGGGKCIDLAKATATLARMDIINVPTSVATCVASSAVCIMYNDDGTPDGSVAMLKEVDVVIADTDIIGTAPKRLLAAGILDSISKLPEVIHNIHVEKYSDCPLEKYICIINSRGIYEFLMGTAREAYDKGIAFEHLTDVILTNLLHTSVVSGFSSGVNQLAIAHGFYDFMRRRFPSESKGYLHGEIVAVGLLSQLRFNNNDDDELLSLMKYMNMPLDAVSVGFIKTEENIALLCDYLVGATGLKPEDRERVMDAISVIL
jgi:glycerol dehydrogenase